METWKKNKSNKLQNSLKTKDTEAFSKREKKEELIMTLQRDRNVNFFMNGHGELNHTRNGELNHIRKFKL